MKPPAPPPPGQRIAKLLARAGIASRREIERMIAEGRVALDGQVLDTPATLITSLRGVTVDGQPVREPAPARLFRFHKPAGLLTTERDPAGRPTIYDRLPRDLPRLVPVGRLDLSTEGLLLLTTDGELKRQLELPSTGVTRIYRARTFGAVSQDQLEQLIHGITIEGVRYGSIDANLERRTGRNQWIELKLTEGKNREVRRVLEHLGLQVSRLIRTAYGPFPLADLPIGAVDEVRQHDLVVFRAALRGGRAASAEPGAMEPSLQPPRAPRPRPDRTPRPRADRPAPPRPDRPAHPSGSAAERTPKPPGNPPARRAQRPSDPRERSRRPDEQPAPKPRRADPPVDRDALIDRPRGPRGRSGPEGARPAPAGAPDSRTPRPKRGAGWAKPKPRTASSSRPTPRGGGGKPGPTRGRPGGGKR